MPKSNPSNTDSNTPVRRSSRARKAPLHSYKDDLPDNILTKVMDGAEPEVKMPEGWGASDDSEDDYTPAKDKNKKFKQKKHSDSTDDDDEGECHNRKRKSAVKSKPDHRQNKKINLKDSREIQKSNYRGESGHVCLLCRGTQEGGDKLRILSDISEVRYHYAECYYRNGAFWEDCPPGEDNTWEGKKRVKDEFGHLVKYSCTRCSWGNMGYKEYCIHTALGHELLEVFLEKDSSYDGMPYVLDKLDMRKK